MPSHFTGIDNASAKLQKMKEFVDNGMAATLDIALDLEERKEGSDGVKELKDLMVQYVHMEREMDQWMDAVQQAKAQFTREYDPAKSEIPDIETIFQKKIEDLESANNDKDLLNHKKIVGFDKKIWKVHHEKEQMIGAGGAEDMDADLIMSQATVQTKCPITLKEMTKPMSSKNCKHSYEKEAIEHMIKKSRVKSVRCPISGCPHTLTLNDLEVNVELEHHIARKKRQT
ncbi:E3 SUMO-protein ligase NSE2 [Nematostella vectensis]|uniref:E3 SUMO-protein ligase NSE2 n=1 Tax=Nematostella vectensis TaxID=45351 RepID=UPI002076DF5D|nr:E3 SUMO-protein ligase NSE2 [Nematostella vectensis]